MIMKKLSLFFVVLVATLSLNAQSITIASYNIRNGNGIDNTKDLKRTASVINSLKADVIAIQEIDSLTNRSGKQDILKDLASLTSMNYAYGSAIPYDGGAYGIGLLTKNKILTTKKVALPGREESRILLICEFDDYVVFATHFSLTEEDAMSSVEIINLEAKKWNKPVILAGDLNIEPNTPVHKALKELFYILSDDSKFTFPADKPNVCIDYIMGYKTHSYKIKKAEVIKASKESDHRPIAVSITVQ